jgi:hypothetical protein
METWWVHSRVFVFLRKARLFGWVVGGTDRSEKVESTETWWAGLTGSWRDNWKEVSQMGSWWGREQGDKADRMETWWDACEGGEIRRKDWDDTDGGMVYKETS